jgi:hypothetical protein
MALHQESSAKEGIRRLLLAVSRELGRRDLTYLGLPAEDALDIKALQTVLGGAICIAPNQEILNETARSIGTIPLKKIVYYKGDAWKFLIGEYAKSIVGDVTYLDFYGGGIRAPFETELAALRNYFRRQAETKNRAFVFAWTYMPRDAGTKEYDNALKFDRLSDKHVKALGRLTGLSKRSYAIRLILARLLMEHEFQVKLYHHAVYKNTMNALILVFSKGIDPKCTVALLPSSVDALVDEPYYLYSEDGKVHEKDLGE